MLKLCAVSYLNTAPFLYGLEYVFDEREFQVIRRPPAECAAHFREGHSDVALVPVGALPDFEAATILPGFCIGATAQVDSVLLVAKCAPEQINVLYLDPDSRTSNGLARLMLRRRWGRAVEIRKADKPLEQVGEDRAAVVIGDKAIGLKERYPYALDLAAEWRDWTGLPFVFAVWVIRPEGVDATRRKRLLEAFAYGVAHLPEIAEQYAGAHNQTPETALHYLTHYIDYRLTDAHRAALTHYLELLTEEDGVPMPHLDFVSI